MLAMFAKLKKYKGVSITSLVALAFAMGGALWAYFALHRIGATPIILHFDDLSGITAVGGLGDLMLAGGAGIAIVIVNFFLALALEERDRFLGKLTAALTLLFAILLFIGFVAIMNVN